MDAIGTTHVQDRRLRAMPRRATLVALLAASALIPAAPATAHGPAPAGIGERRLRALEERLLGHEHAVEHALQRRLARRARRAGVRPQRIRPRAFAAQAADAPADGAWAGPYPILLSGQNRGVMAINAVMLPTGKVLWFAYPVEPGSAVPQERGLRRRLGSRATGALQATFDPPIDPRTGKPANIWCAGTSLPGRRPGARDGRQPRLLSRPTRAPRAEPGLHVQPVHRDVAAPPGHGARGAGTRARCSCRTGARSIIQGLDEAGTSANNRDVEIFDAVAKPGRARHDHARSATLPSGARRRLLPAHVLDALRARLHRRARPAGLVVPAAARRRRTCSRRSDARRTRARAHLGHRRAAAAEPRQRRATVHADRRLGHRRQTTTHVAGDRDRPRPSTRRRTRWTAAPSLNVARGHPNTVLLPDGVMVTSAAASAARTATRNGSGRRPRPAARSSCAIRPRARGGSGRRRPRAAPTTPPPAAARRPRLSAGDDRNGGFDRDTYEIYSPPYLFTGARGPSIASAPARVGYGRTFAVGTPNTDIDRAVLVAPGAATHAVDMNQRVVMLPVARRADGLGYDLRTPASANIAPPGYYMLFLVDTAGRPSVARWVRVFPRRTRAAAAATSCAALAARPDPAGYRPGLRRGHEAPTRARAAAHALRPCGAAHSDAQVEAEPE